MDPSAPDLAEIAQRRYENALRLFDEFVRSVVRQPDPVALRGLERRFAEHVLIQPSYWSQIKSRTRQIGERLARQFEQRCRKPVGWMDQPHDGTQVPVPPATGIDDDPLPASSVPRDDDERFIVGLVLSYYRRHPQRARARLLDLLGEVLTTPPPQAAAAAPAPDDGQALWRKSQAGVAPLKPRRR
jgi:hypothetical protein